MKALLCLPQMAISSLSILCLIVVAVALLRTSALHINCRCLLLATLFSHFVLVAIQLGLCSYEFVTSRADVNDIDGIETWIAVHSLAYAHASACTAWVSGERLYATLGNTRAYASKRRPSIIGSAIFVASTFGFSLWWVWYGTLERHYIGCIVVMFVVDCSVSAFSIGSFFYSRWLYRWALGRVSLNERYLLSDVLEYNRAVLPICVLTSVIKSLALIPFLFWLLLPGSLDYVESRSIYQTCVTLNCVLTKTLLVRRHRALLRSIKRIPVLSLLLCHRPGPAVSPTEGAIVFQSADDHFDMLQSTWERRTRA